MITKKDITKLVDSLNIFTEYSKDMINSIIYGFQKCKKLRISGIAATLPGNYHSNEKRIARALDKLDISMLLSGLSAFASIDDKVYLLDLTDMTRNNATKTSYIGYLKDGKTHGYSILTISVPYKGRSRVIFADIISSTIINNSAIGKWKLIQNAIEPIVHLLKSKIIAIDREFCNEEMINFFRRNGIHYVIRLKISAGKGEIKITNKKGERINLSVKRGRKKNWHSVYYKGKIKVNIAAEWQSNMSEPMYIITDCTPSDGLKYYKIRMKIEESFKDIKDKLGFTKLMNKKLTNLVKLLLIGLLTYNLLLLIGESLRQAVLSKNERFRFSGLHLLLNMVYRYTRSRLRIVIRRVEKYLQKINSSKPSINLSIRSV